MALSYDELTAAQKAAIALIAVGSEVSAKVLKELSDGPPTDVSWVIFPMDKVVPFRSGGWIFPELFFLVELPSELVVQRSPCFLEVWGEHFMSVAPVEDDEIPIRTSP